jgi:ABC-type phosphate transport system substrate-binding protein
MFNNIKSKVLLCLTTLLLSFTSLADVSVIVNSGNGSAIDDADISRIFLGKVKQFSGGDKITIINLKFKEATRNEFEEKVLKKSASQVKAYWSKLMFSGKGKPPKELGSDKEVIAFVAANPGAIGYIAAASADGSVKVVKTY